jgi:hypothetical protein
MTLIRILLGLFTAILKAFTSSFLLLLSTLGTALAVILLVGFVAISLTGVVSLRLSRRRAARRS